MLVGSPLEGIGRVARTSSILGASFSLAGSWGTVKGLVASEATTFVSSVTFSFAPSCLATFGGLPKEGRALLGLLFSGFATSGGASGLAMLEEEAWMGGG